MHVQWGKDSSRKVGYPTTKIVMTSCNEAVLITIKVAGYLEGIISSVTVGR